MFNKITTIFLVGIIIFSWAVTFAQQEINTQQQMPHPPKHAGDLIGKFIHDNAAAEVLSALTSQPIETIKANINGKNIRDILITYSIEEQNFKKAMDVKNMETAQKAQQCGLITQEQLTDLIQKIQQHINKTSKQPNS